MIFKYTIEMWQLVLQGNKQGILFFMALYFFLASSYATFLQLRVRSWPNTKGILIRSNIEAGVATYSKSDQNFMVDLLYEYSVDGIKYHGRRLSLWFIMATYNFRFLLKKQLKGITKNNDSSVVVYYNPYNPQRCFLIKPSILGLFVTSAIAVLPVFYYWLEYHG